MIWPAMAWPWTKKKVGRGWRCAFLTGHSHHIVGFGGTGSAQHHQFLLAADVTVHHGAHWPVVSWGGASHGAGRRSWGAGLRLVQDADGAVLTDAVGHLEGVHPQRELTGQQQVELLDGQADALARLPHQWVHLVVDADAAVSWTLAGSVWEPVVLILLCIDKKERMEGEFSFGVMWAKIMSWDRRVNKRKDITESWVTLDYRRLNKGRTRPLDESMWLHKQTVIWPSKLFMSRWEHHKSNKNPWCLLKGLICEILVYYILFQ